MAKLKGDENDNQVEPPLLSYEEHEDIYALSEMWDCYVACGVIPLCLAPAISIIVAIINDIITRGVLSLVLPLVLSSLSTLLLVAIAIISSIIPSDFRNAIITVYPEYHNKRLGLVYVPEPNEKVDIESAKRTIKKWITFKALLALWTESWATWRDDWISYLNGICSNIVGFFYKLVCFDTINCSLCGMSFSCRKNKEKRKNIK